MIGCMSFVVASLVSFLIQQAAAPEPSESVEVQVTVTIEEGNLTKAREVAQAEAFRQAIKKSYEEGASAEEVEAKLKKASQLVKSFRVIDEKNNGKELVSTLRVEVLKTGPSDVSVPVVQESSNFVLEITWDPAIVRMNSQDIFGFLKDRLQMQPQSFRLNRGVLSIVLPASVDPQNVQQQVSAYLSDRGQVRLTERSVVATPVETVPLVPTEIPPEPAATNSIAPVNP